MKEPVQHLPESADRLSKDERHEAALERTRHLEHTPLDDEALARIADESFQRYDTDEAARYEAPRGRTV